ncbi:MAG: DNA replication/repair protein RecF [Nitratireductor sp.]|nr:DNA replication/repair protein RecF [Nitratireductor sp.]
MTERTRVHLTRLKLSGFRNYDALDLATDKRHVVLCGENGAGKTNLLEAVSFLSPGRGMRRANYDTVGKNGGTGAWSVFAELEGAAGQVSIGTGIQLGAMGLETQRRARINGTQARTADELSDHARIVWLTPSMDGLFTGPALERRKFLDRLVLAMDPAHGRRVADYEKSMRARNRLLSDENPDRAWLDAIEGQLAAAGVAIALARIELVSLLSGVIIRTSNPASPFPDALVRLEGSLEALADDTPASDMEGEYAERLRNSRRIDSAAGRTLEGPHRSDLRVMHRPKGMPAEHCSTGEQKALLVGMVLAHARLVADLAGYAPILLLDEIAAHLDSGRRAALFDIIDALDCQAWMTGTDRALFDAMNERARYFTVSAGSVVEDRIDP